MFTRIDNPRTRDSCGGVKEDLNEDGFEDSGEVTEDLKKELLRTKKNPLTKSRSKTTCFITSWH